MRKKYFNTSKGEFMIVEDNGGLPPDFIHKFYEGVGYLDNITEEQAENVVEYHATLKKFKNYSTESTSATSVFTMESALASLNSLLKLSEILFRNPYDNTDDRFKTKEPVCFLGVRPCNHIKLSNGEFRECICLKWEETQKNVWDKSRTYLFKKI